MGFSILKRPMLVKSAMYSLKWYLHGATIFLIFFSGKRLFVLEPKDLTLREAWEGAWIFT